jgi:hypothetical protein
MLKKKKLFNELAYEDFLSRYLLNHEEFRFHYKSYVINLCWGPNGTYEYNITENNKMVKTRDYTTPEEVIENFIFDNKKFKDIYWEFE